MSEVNIKFTYLEQPPKKFTFEQPKLKQWVEGQCKGKVLNLFAGKTKLNVNETRVDLSNEYNPHYCMDSFEFVLMAKKRGWRYDTILLDPPYSLRKSMEKYNGKTCSNFVKIKEEIPNILNSNGRVITFGYTSVCMGKVRGFKKVEVCLVCHSGSHHDTVVIVEEKL